MVCPNENKDFKSQRLPLSAIFMICPNENKCKDHMRRENQVATSIENPTRNCTLDIYEQKKYNKTI